MTARPTPPHGRPPVEELSELTWARVEKRLWTELDRAPVAVAPASIGRPRRWPWLAGMALAAAAAAVVAAVAWPSSVPSVAIQAPSRVVTAAAPTEVTYGDAAITVAPSSAVLLQGQADRGVTIVLDRGSATFAVAPRLWRPPFMVLAGAVQVRVIGTRFTVTRSGDDARVDVAHGEVEVVAWGRREVLLAGASWSSDGVREAAVGGSAPVANPSGVAAAHFSPPQPSPSPAPARTVPAPSGAASVAGSGASTAVADQPVAPPVLDTPDAMYNRAAALEPTSPAAALKLYRNVALGDSKWAAPALYAAARLARSLGVHDTALGYATLYLKRFPTGDNAADARDVQKWAQRANP